MPGSEPLRCRSHTKQEELRVAPPERQCTGKSSFTGERCRKPAIRGHHVCATHGGSAKQVKAAAKQTILEAVEGRLARMIQLSEQSEHLPTAFSATAHILNRGIGKPDAQNASLNQKGITVNVGIALGGFDPNRRDASKSQIGVNLLAASDYDDEEEDGAIEGEVITPDDESDSDE